MKQYITTIAAFGAAAWLNVSANAQDGFDDDNRRPQLNQMAEDAIEDLRDQNEVADTLWDEAYGYAVFDTTKGGLIVTGVGGTGVAQPKGSGDETFMHVGGGGVGLGAGLENYKLVLLIQDQETYDAFVHGSWDGSIAAQAAAGDSGVSAEAQFQDGVVAFRMTEGGLMAQVDVTALRFWPSEDLNRSA